ncbi:MAG: acetate--CoA ligase family protein [Anaerolineaceae bacterium]|nr:acetate--CoA ligase family protein [Anaerolineaceae bacterium]
MINGISSFFSPKGVAIIGASSKPNKLSYGILENLTKYHYQGGIYPINPNADMILGCKCYKDVRDVPNPIELGVIVLPASMTVEAMQACADSGIKAVIIISGGFREVGEDGKALEESCLKIAKDNGMRIIGPNCVGTMDMNSGLDTTFIKGMPEAGPIGFVSQSGAVCGGVVDLIIDKHIGFSHFASLGNELDVSEADVIEYFGGDPNVKVIAVYVEGIQDGKRFIKVAKKVSKIKPIVLLKAGRSDEGAKAVSSHTGSLAGSYAAYQAAFKQTGVIEVNDIRELFNVAWALGCLKLPGGKNVAIVTNAGGPAALASDSLAANGFNLAEISAETQLTLKSKLNPSAQVGNPIDMLGGAEAQEYDACLEALIQDKGVDVLMPILVPQSLVDPLSVAKAFLKNSASGKPLLACMMGEHSIIEARNLLHQNHIPLYQYPEDMGIVLGAMQQYHTFLNQEDQDIISFQNADRQSVKNVLQKMVNRKSLGENETRPLLSAYGIPVIPGRLAQTIDEAVQIAEEIGYPVAMKIVSDDILHKTDTGGIKLNLHTAEKVKEAYNFMLDNIRHTLPLAKLDGVLIEAMAPHGQEVIVGMRDDPTFGPLIMVGMGGIYVELRKDVAFKVAPLSKADIKDMILNTYAGKLLQGYRGGAPGDMDALIDVIGKLSQLALDNPEIKEFEINPLLVLEDGKGVIALDSRAIIDDEDLS